MRVPGYKADLTKSYNHLVTEAKTCKMCGEIKYFTEFNYNTDNPDGLTVYCRICLCKGIKD